LQAIDAAEAQLYDPQSSTFDEEQYREVIINALNSLLLSDTDKIRFRYQLQDIDKNRKGYVANDFIYIDTNGQPGSLHSFGNKSALKLIIFYDPECDHCATLITELRNNQHVDSLIRAQKLCILAIAPDSDTNAIQTFQHNIPQDWTNAYSPDGALGNEDIYVFRTSPTIYILSSDNIVLAKELNRERLFNYLESISISM
jgi:hypothetical protein